MTPPVRDSARPSRRHRTSFDRQPDSPSGLKIDTLAIDDDAATIQLRGELDVSTAGLLNAALKERLRQGNTIVRLDLSSLTFVDCAGLRAIVGLHNEFLYCSGDLVLTGVDGCTARLLRLTHLDEALQIEDSPNRPRRGRHLRSVPKPKAS